MPHVDLNPLKQRMQTPGRQPSADFRQHPRPDMLLTELRRIVDQELRELVSCVRCRPEATLAAVGGYGCGELLSAFRRRPADPAAAVPVGGRCARGRGIGGRPGDLGLEPAIACASLEDCEREARGDITVETALLESRWLAGSRTLMKRLTAPCRHGWTRRCSSRPSGWRCSSATPATRIRPTRWNPTARESPGGLRDLQASSCGWPAPPASATAGARVGPGRFAHSVRSATTARRTGLQAPAHRAAPADGPARRPRPVRPATGLAAVYGIASTATRRASELLMQRYYWPRAW